MVNVTPAPQLVLSPPSVAARPVVQAAAQPLPSADPAARIPGAAGLSARLNAVLAGSDTKISGAVIDAAARRVLYGRNPDRPATPASTTKLVTSVAVLATRGPEYRLTTKTVQGAPGRVVLVGGGDPTLAVRPPASLPGSASLTELARQTAAALRASGTARVKVDFDDTLYTGPRSAPGWKPNYIPDGEVAPVTALMVDQGRVAAGKRTRVADPPATAAAVFAGLLRRQGVAATRGARVRAHPSAAALGSVRSPPVSAMVEHLMTESDNDMAEAMVRQAALARGRPASFAGGAQAVQEVLAGLRAAGGVTVFDGSGLSTRNRITPLALARLAALAAAPDHPGLRAAITGMPVAGFSGTLADRYAGPATRIGAGYVRAKTGTLDGVSTLAGMAYDVDGRLLAFAFMAGDGKGAVDPGRLDLLAAAVAGCGCG
ncbi:D-alanyl-D-alanine carboxypeptidase/D-alanyl-D-alanine endopeptidase [Actinomadura craniellae]|uniref:D-alanyl-D-alanine carboxypeptidase/D-alanyl-D-alanine endopeptidase n=1 Tax=Actinomadura craniellae TaxID=2231787 RepID=UPI001F21FBD1|nr:D-alanyl-D-alanine carboxypeptidase/D-alanyl-D-alanine-endopeptidase [Actinomadura craniellae]